MVAVVVGGMVSYYRLGRNEDPAFIIKTMIVQAAMALRDPGRHPPAGHRAA
jgi:multidrug efflux pump subunit AcrB